MGSNDVRSDERPTIEGAAQEVTGVSRRRRSLRRHLGGPGSRLMLSSDRPSYLDSCRRRPRARVVAVGWKSSRHFSLVASFYRWCPLAGRLLIYTLAVHRARSASRLKPLLRVVRGSRKAGRKACADGGRKRHRLAVLLFADIDPDRRVPSVLASSTARKQSPIPSPYLFSETTLRSSATSLSAPAGDRLRFASPYHAGGMTSSSGGVRVVYLPAR
jgi:hypothetical protein